MLTNFRAFFLTDSLQIQLHISGLTGTTRADGSAVASAAEQCELTYDKVGAALEAAGMSWADVVHRTTWLTDECGLGDVNVGTPPSHSSALWC